MNFSNTLVVLFVLLFSTAFGQQNIKAFDFKKGEILDVIILSQTNDSAALFDTYKRTAFPVAFEYTYQPQPGFGISKLTLGTNKASAFLFGKWNSRKDREGFLATIADRVPDFHEQRRNLFPYFGLTYYEMQTDLTFSVDTSKYNLVTSFWNRPSDQNQSFFNTWKSNVESSGGSVILTLNEGTSPTGYYYNPAILCITTWENEAAFKTFSEKYPLSTYDSLENVHQFVIQ